MHTDIHASSRIRTHNASVLAGGDGSCLRRRGHCDWQNLPIMEHKYSLQSLKELTTGCVLKQKKAVHILTPGNLRFTLLFSHLYLDLIALGVPK
jgi:hypothetical protein